MQSKEILQKPDASDAVNGRQMQRDLRLPVVGEVQQLLLHSRIIQKCPLLLLSCALYLCPRRLAEFVELAQSVLEEKAVNRLAAQTAKRPGARRKHAAHARFPAMKAPRLLSSFVVTHRLAPAEIVG